MTRDLSTRTRELALQLVEWPSEGGTPGEALFARQLHDLLGRNEYFALHPDHLVLVPIPNDALGRANVLALVKGSGPRTVILSGHFDVVPIDDYGDLAPLAGQSLVLAGRLIARLRSSGADPLALVDLESGAFLPGRGMLDMKSGVAAAIAVLEAFAEDPDIGNLLLVATPDEENQSAGMRAAIADIAALVQAHALEPVLAINLDAILDKGDGSQGQVIAMGSVGKLLLSAFVVGKDAHACAPMDGVNGAYLAAELITTFEFAPELGELNGSELATPPAVLGVRDLKPGYNVTTPSRVWVFWNVMIHRRPAAEVLRQATRLARVAADRARDRLADRARQFGTPAALTDDWKAIPIQTYAELVSRSATRDPAFPDRLAVRAQELATRVDLDFPSRSKHLIELAWEASGQTGPAIVFAIGSLPYPAVRLAAQHDALRAKIAAIATATGARANTAIGSIEWFPGISDMSFLGVADPADIAVVAANCPLWGSSIQWSEPQSALANLPVINIGPWGRDYHHWLERVHVDYTFRVLPILIQDCCRAVLAEPAA